MTRIATKPVIDTRKRKKVNPAHTSLSPPAKLNRLTRISGSLPRTHSLQELCIANAGRQRRPTRSHSSTSLDNLRDGRRGRAKAGTHMQLRHCPGPGLSGPGMSKGARQVTIDSPSLSRDQIRPLNITALNKAIARIEAPNRRPILFMISWRVQRRSGQEARRRLQ